MGDQDRIQQVMLNLTSNARKYVHKVCGVIEIQTQLLIKGAQQFIQISVSNNGHGISLADQAKLFQPFSKLTANKEMNPNGNGLGLYICKQVCIILGGDIEV